MGFKTMSYTHSLRSLLKFIRNHKIAVASVLTLTLILSAFTVVPYVVARSVLGRTPFDNPGFSIRAIQVSKNGTNCQIQSVVENTGNVYIAMLTLTLNQTYVWDDAWIAPGHAASDRQLFVNYGDLHCSNLKPGQTYIAGFLARFADGDKQTLVTTVQVQPYPVFYWY